MSAPTSASAVTSTRVGRDTAIMAVGTTLSRVTGLLRTIALAYALGSLALADAYNLANTIPNIIHDIVLGGIVSATFIPVFVERLSTRSDDDAWEAISAVTSVTLLVVGAATVLFLALSPLIIDATTALNHSANAGSTRHVATVLLVLFVPQLAGYGFISLATALLNSRRRFGAPMFTPIANNLVLIAVLVYFGITVRQPTVAGVSAHQGQLLLLGLGTTFGVVAQALLLIPSLRRAGLRLRWRPDFHHEAVRTILRLSSWTFGLVMANQVALLVVLAMSQSVGRGAVTAYTYAYTFFQLPYGIVAVSIMAATAPELTTHWAVGDIDAFRHRMAVGLRTMLAIIIPAAAGLVILARPLMALLLAHGASASIPHSTVPTATALAVLSLGLPGFCVFLYAIRVLQSVQDLRSAFWLYVLENAINIVFAVALAGPLGIRGIAASIAIAYTVAAVLAIVRIRDLVHGIDGGLLARQLGHVLVATAVLVVATVLASNVTNAPNGPGLLARVVLGVVAGAGAYFLTAAVLAMLFGRRADGQARTPRPPAGGPPPPRTVDVIGVYRPGGEVDIIGISREREAEGSEGTSEQDKDQSRRTGSVLAAYKEGEGVRVDPRQGEGADDEDTSTRTGSVLAAYKEGEGRPVDAPEGAGAEGGRSSAPPDDDEGDGGSTH